MPKQDFSKYEFDQKEADKLENQVQGREFSGVYCPNRNDHKACAVCRDVKVLWEAHNQTGLDKSKFRDKAKKYQATAAVFMNVVFPENPSEVKILQCGIKVAQSLVNGIKYMKWGSIYHPQKGFTMTINKSTKDGYNTYTPSPNVEKGKRELADLSVLERMYNLDKIEEIRQGADIFNVSSMEVNKSIDVDILPGWDSGNPHQFFKIVYYHFKVGPEAIKEGIPKEGALPTDDDEGPWGGENKKESPFDTDMPATKQEKPKEIKKLIYNRENAPQCFGTLFDEADDGCNAIECSQIREACKEELMKKKAAKKGGTAVQEEKKMDDIPW